MDNMSTLTGAISLQDQSFLYVLSRVECYPASYLAMLPKTWRERLLRAVPPFQLYKLAKTDVALGINVDNIWEDMATLKDSIWATYFATTNEEGDLLTLSSIDDDESMMTRFFDYINHLYFMEQNRPYACHRMRELLFTVHKDNLDSPLVNKLLKSHIQSLFMHSPPYYLAPFRCPSYSESKIAQMMVDLEALPLSLEINMKCVPRYTFCESDTNTRLLSSLRRVRVYCSLNDRELFRILKQIVGYRRNSLSSSYGSIVDSNLESLELLNCSQYTIQKITPLFSPAHGYNHLSCLHISMLSHSACMRYLPGILKHQMNTLQELKLTKFELSHNAGIIGTSDYTLNITLSQLILRPQFRKLILDDFRRLPQMFAVNIIQSFLRSIPNHKQTICFRNSQICHSGKVPFHVKRFGSETSEDCDDSNLAMLFHPACTEECIKYKYLILDDILLPVEFLEWMCNIDSIYLNTLILQDISLLPKLPPRKRLLKDFDQGEDMQACDPWQMFDNHPNMICGTFFYSSKSLW